MNLSNRVVSDVNWVSTTPTMVDFLSDLPDDEVPSDGAKDSDGINGVYLGLYESIRGGDDDVGCGTWWSSSNLGM